MKFDKNERYLAHEAEAGMYIHVVRCLNTVSLCLLLQYYISSGALGSPALPLYHVLL